MSEPTIFFEDFIVGQVHPAGVCSVSEEEIIAFATRFDPQPFHIDPVRASASIYGGIIASGWHTCGMAMRMMCDSFLFKTASLGSPGMDQIRWLKPVRGGDTLTGKWEVLETIPSTSKPDRGVVKSDWRVYNQHDELVLKMLGMGMYRRRPGGGV